MSTTPTPPPNRKATASDTKRDAPRQALPWVIGLGVLAIVLVLVGMHYLDGMK